MRVRSDSKTRCRYAAAGAKAADSLGGRQHRSAECRGVRRPRCNRAWHRRSRAGSGPNLMDTRLVGKRVLVTGASGGIGSACARAFAAEGCRLVLHYNRGRERVEALASELDDVVVAQADLTREDDVERLFAEGLDALRGLDACAAVAGIWPEEDVPLWQLSLERWEGTLRSNLTASFLTARGFLREVERNGHGSLVLVGSTAGVVGEAGHADYAAAKSAILHGLLLSLKNEIVRIAPRGRVNAVAPGWTESPMTRGHVSPERVDRITRTMALRK